MTGAQRIVSILLLALVALILAAIAEGKPVPGAPSCPMTPTDSFWHADVSGLPVHPQSATWISSIGATAGLKADFGAGMWNGGPIGIPYTTVPGTQARVPVSFGYDDESDPGPYPIPPNAPIEGGSSSTGDRHVLVVDRDACRLWELYSAYPQNGGASWTAGSGATWDLNSNAMRPLGWTSGDAAGLPILPGLVRYDEVVAGAIDHVIRFTAPRTANAYVWPASHKAASGGASDPPMGAWLRLKASFDISGFSAQNQVILRALKKHGMVLADNGSPWFMSGAPDPGWNDSGLQGTADGPGLGVRSGRRVQAEGVEHLVRRGGRAAASTPPPPPASAHRRRLRLRSSSSPTRASRPASAAGRGATAARRSLGRAPLPTAARARPSSVARGRRATRCSTIRRTRSRPPPPARPTRARPGCAHPPDAR